MKKFLIGFALFIGSLFLFKEPILQVSLPLFLPSSTVFDKVEWQDGKIQVLGLHFQEEGVQLHVDRAELVFKPSLKPLFLQAHLSVSHPEVTLLCEEEAKTAFPLFLLFPHRFWEMKLQVDNGVLNLSDSKGVQRFYFAFNKGEKKEEIGHFLLTSDPALFHLPLLRMDINKSEQSLAAHLKTEAIAGARLFQLIEAFYPPALGGWKSSEGVVELEAHAKLSRKGLTAFNGSLKGTSFNLFHPTHQLELGAKEIEAKISLPFLSEKKDQLLNALTTTLSFKGGDCQKQGVKIFTGVDGKLIAEPQKELDLVLKGQLNCKEKLLPFSARGKGEVQKEGPFWGSVDLALGSATFATFSFSHPHSKEYLLQTEIKKMEPEFLSLLNEWVPLGLQSGALEGKITAEIKQDTLQRILMQGVQLQKLSFDQQKNKGQIEALQIDGVLSARGAGWKIDRLSLQSQGADLRLGPAHLFTQELNLAVSDQEIVKCDFKGRIAGVGATAQVHRSPHAPATGYSLLGNLTLTSASSQTCQMEFGCDFTRKNISSLTEILSFLRPPKGWVRCPSLSPNFYRDFLKSFYPQIDLEGEVDLYGTLEEKELQLSIQSDELLLHHPSLDMRIPHLGVKDPLLLKREGRAQISYNFETGLIDAHIPLHGGRVLEKRHFLDFQNIEGVCKIEKGEVVIEEMKAECEGVLFNGKLTLAKADTGFDLNFESRQLSATSASFYTLLKRFATLPASLSSLKAKVASGERGFSFYAHLGDAREKTAWRFKGKLYEGELKLAPSVVFKDLSWDLEADSHSQSYLLKNGLAFLEMEGTLFNLEIPEIAFRKEEVISGGFDLRLKQEKKEVVRLSGSIQGKKDRSTSLLFDPAKSHFFQTKLAGDLSIEAGGKIRSFDSELTIQGKELASHLNFLKKCKLLSFDPALVSSQGSIALRLHFQEFLSFEAEGSQLVLQGKSFNNFRVKGKRKGVEWFIDRLSLDGMLLKTNFIVKNDRIVVPLFEVKTPASLIQGEGVFEGERKRFTSTIHSFSVELNKIAQQAKGSAQGRAKATFDLTTGLVEGEAQVECHLLAPTALTIKSEKNLPFTYSFADGLLIKKAELFLPEKNMNLNLEEIFLDKQMKKGGAKRGALVSIPPLFGTTSWELRDLLFSQEKGAWEMNVWTAFQEQPLFLQVDCPSTAERHLFIQLKEEPQAEGIKLQGKYANSWQWRSLQGKLFGVELDLRAKQEDSLSGIVRVDWRKLAPFFPKKGKEFTQLLQLGKGYELHGDFLLPKVGKPHFRGKLIGRNFECMGYIISNMEADTEISAERLLMKHLSMSDVGGKLQVKLCRIEKTPSDLWQLEVPFVHIQDLYPSKLRREKVQAQTIKPLLVKNFSLSDMKGELGRPSTIRAKGHLNFTNAFRRESSLFDRPIEFIKNLGLDPDLLVPVYGEIDVELKAGKFYLTELKNAYSDGKRSQFFLSEEKASFIDLNGNIYVDVKMRQNVALKLIEPFTLKVRGTLDKPKYGL